MNQTFRNLIASSHKENDRHMPSTTTSAGHAAQLSTLVNPDRIRSSIKRLFRNRIDEVLNEILQNGQRARATTITITSTGNTFTIQDNGHGLLDGINGFHTLLKIAESHFDNDTIEAQDPMGLGIVSLLTHDQITEVTFSSGSLELTIDTRQWWTDSEYYSRWYERLITLDTPVDGLRIFARCSPDVIAKLHDALQPKNSVSVYRSTVDPFEHASPAQGYEGILNITLNGQSVPTYLPAWTKHDDTLITTTFKGSKIRIGFNAQTTKSSILWFGQLIPIEGLEGSRHGFNFHLEVTSGRPVNPLSPSRAGVIHDAAYKELLEFVKNAIFAFVFDLKNRRTIRPQHVASCFHLDSKRSLSDSPYIVATEIQLNPDPNSFDDFSAAPTSNDQPAQTTLFTYDKAPLLLNETVLVQLDGSEGISHEHSYGLPSFVPELGNAFTLDHGDPSRLPIKTLWWKPAGTPQHDSFYQAGVYGLSSNDQPPIDWIGITNTPVYAFSEPSSYDAAEVDFIVGTSDILAFLKNQVWAGFLTNDEDDYDRQEESFRSTVDHLIRTVIGKCVPNDFTLYDLRKFFSDNTAPIISVTYHYQRNGRPFNPRKQYRPNKKNNVPAIPTHVTAQNSLGKKVRLKLY